MQFKGLVRFFTILLIIYSLYQLSFTFFVRRHENKMEKLAWQQVKARPEFAKFADTDDLPDSLLDIYKERLQRLLDSTRDVTLTYGVTGKISYDKAKREELNLGLDLQGGMNITLDVEMKDLLMTLADGNKDPKFLLALDNAEKRKVNSDLNFVTLFVQEYAALAGPNRLAPLFVTQLKSEIAITSSDSQVEGVLREKANEAFKTTYDILRKRIDRFGVAQPSINADNLRGTITVELPGALDRERVKQNLQTSANLQFFETYPWMAPEMQQALDNAAASFDLLMNGQTDTAGVKKDTARANDTLGLRNDTLPATNSQNKPDTGGLADKIKQQNPQNAGTATAKRFFDYVLRNPQRPGEILINTTDTAIIFDYLNNPSIRRHFPADAVFALGQSNEEDRKHLELYLLRTYNRDKPFIEGSQVSKAEQSFNPNGQPTVTMELDKDAQKTWAQMTGRSFDGWNKNKNIKIPIAIVMDGIVLSAPAANNGPIEGSNTEISGNFTVESAKDLANMLNIGKASAKPKIIQLQEVGPTLGAQAIRNGMFAFLIAFIVIFVLMLVYYNTSGWVTNIALILNLLFTIGILSGLGASLTAPGIAGLILTIGLAVDTNVITKERIKEELTKGKGYLPAVNEAFRRSLPPILDGHVTILLTAVILFYFGLGPVKGFATTQILGILLSLFSGVLVTRWITDIFNKRKIHLEYFTKVSRGIFQKAAFNFVAFRKKAFMISFIVLCLGVGSFFNGFDYGVEFDGGNSYVVDFKKPVDVEVIRKDLEKAFDGENTIIKTFGSSSQLDITTAYLIRDTTHSREVRDSLIPAKLFEGLKAHLPAGVTEEQFVKTTQYIQRTTHVDPTISDDLRKGAVNATIFAIIAIFLYIFIRFRDWRYSIGTIIALLHDVLVTLAVFSFCRSFVPFPLEIDQHFIAAILTVIGFSMNEAVIIFDRIREDRKLYPSAALGDTINRAINETLSRTIMTSLTVFLTILTIFIVGGEVTRGFAFAMLIGVITGVYSSMFVAAPMLLNLGRKKDVSGGAATKEVKTTTTKS
jgi:SecD/SecF fusion protein